MLHYDVITWYRKWSETLTSTSLPTPNPSSPTQEVLQREVPGFLCRPSVIVSLVVRRPRLRSTLPHYSCTPSEGERPRPRTSCGTVAH